ncbi:MAG TPA: sigma 54-interacting transcriptional regulator [Terriglobales bacterium]|nr:sigma 54-interacting transcriptional regulator [Terriglobales bacterium]
MLTPTARAQSVRFHDLEAVICSEPMHKLVAMAERVARGSASVLITGETGSGKELIARAIHHHSARASRPWIDVNCAALPEHLVESELFGYEKGAFSGADSSKAGLFELADKGTLFLDEIGELEPKVQVKLLRVLDGAPYFRLGGSRKVAVDVRILAATNRPLEEAVRSGRFRSDLYHRIGQIQLRVPPLRDRPDDIAALAEFFLSRSHPGMRLSSAALERLRAYAWPGNIRELRNVLMQAATLAEGEEVRVDDLPAEIAGEAAAPVPAGSFDKLSAGTGTSRRGNGSASKLDDIEKNAILQTLQGVGGHQGMAAEKLGISRRTLSRKLKQYHLDSEAAGPGAEPLGTLSEAEQRYYRARVDVPAQLRTAEGEFEARITNISKGGVALDGIRTPFRLAGAFDMRFVLPGSGVTIESKCQLVWAEPQGRAGVHFVDLPATLQVSINRWLKQMQRDEGWYIGAPSSAEA